MLSRAAICRRSAVRERNTQRRWSPRTYDTRQGRGGTAFSPAFEKIDELNEDIEACVYLTDLGSDDFGEEPIYPVLSVSTDKHLQAPWGETIKMELTS